MEARVQAQPSLIVRSSQGTSVYAVDARVLCSPPLVFSAYLKQSLDGKLRRKVAVRLLISSNNPIPHMRLYLQAAGGSESVVEALLDS